MSDRLQPLIPAFWSAAKDRSPVKITTARLGGAKAAMDRWPLALSVLPPSMLLPTSVSFGLLTQRCDGLEPPRLFLTILGSEADAATDAYRCVEKVQSELLERRT